MCYESAVLTSCFTKESGESREPEQSVGETDDSEPDTEAFLRTPN